MKHLSTLCVAMSLMTFVSCKKSNKTPVTVPPPVVVNPPEGKTIKEKLTYADVAISGTPYTIFGKTVSGPDDAQYTSGGKPSEVIALPVSDTEVAVAWQEQTVGGTKRDIHITTINTTSNTVIKDITYNIPYPTPYLTKNENKLQGFTLITDGSGDYALAYNDFTIRKDAAGDGGEYIVVRLKSDGKVVWTQRNILGTFPVSPAIAGTKLRPGYASQGGSRIIYADNVIVVFASHREQNEAGEQHQAAIFTLINSSNGVLYKAGTLYDKSAVGRPDLPLPNPTDAGGNKVTVPDVAPASPYPNDDFIISHNFDERIIYDAASTSFVTMSLGDAYPRAIPVFFHKKGGSIDKNTHLIDIKSGSGNKTLTQLGGIVKTSAGFAGSFTTQSERTGMDVGVGYVVGQALKKVAWLTTYTTEKAIHPKLANLGSNLFVTWKLYNADKSTTPYGAVVDLDGKILYGPDKLDDAVSFNHTDDIFSYPNGDAGWVVGNGTGKLRVYKMKKF